MGRRHRLRASARERAIAKDTGGTRVPLSGAGGGVDISGPLVDIEETANQAITRGIRLWWESKALVTKTAALYSRALVPRALVLTWDRRKRLVVMTYDDWRWLLGQMNDDEPTESSHHVK